MDDSLEQFTDDGRTDYRSIDSLGDDFEKVIGSGEAAVVPEPAPEHEDLVQGGKYYDSVQRMIAVAVARALSGVALDKAAMEDKIEAQEVKIDEMRETLRTIERVMQTALAQVKTAIEDDVDLSRRMSALEGGAPIIAAPVSQTTVTPHSGGKSALDWEMLLIRGKTRLQCIRMGMPPQILLGYP